MTGLQDPNVKGALPGGPSNSTTGRRTPICSASSRKQSASGGIFDSVGSPPKSVQLTQIGGKDGESRHGQNENRDRCRTQEDQSDVHSVEWTGMESNAT